MRKWNSDGILLSKLLPPHSFTKPVVSKLVSYESLTTQSSQGKQQPMDMLILLYSPSFKLRLSQDIFSHPIIPKLYLLNEK